MKPIFLKLVNIGPFYGEHTLDFSNLGEMYLICGKTGAGKTTIFDAMTYALYGKLPGSRSSLGPKALFSDFATQDDVCQIEFLFEVKRQKYLIRRNPPKNQEKKTSQDGKVVLYQIEKDGSEKFINDKKSEVEDFIVSLIGLTKDEFARIVLLPQGEFAAFLKQSSKEKQVTLSKLFPSEYYSKIIERVKKINDEIYTEKKVIQGQIESILENFNPQTYEDEITAKKSELETLSDKNQKMEKTLQKIEKSLIEKNQEIQKIKKTLSNKNDLTSLLLENDSILEKEELIEKAEKSDKILPLINSKNQAEKQYNQLLLELEETKNQLIEAESVLEKATKEKEKVSKLSEKLEKEKITEEKLKNASEKFLNLKKSKKNAEKLTSEKSDLESEKSKIESEVKSIEENLKLLTKNTENYVQLVEEKNLSNKSYQDFEELQKLFCEKQDYLEKSKSIFSEIQNTEKLLTSNQELLEEYKNQLEESKNQNLAFILGEKLEENQPCPVCGSLHHPNIIKSHVDYKSIEEKIDIQEKNVNSQKSNLDGLKNKSAQIEALKDSVSKNLEEKLNEGIKTFGKNQTLLKNNPNVDFSNSLSLEKLVSEKENILIFENAKNAIEDKIKNMDKMIQDKEIAEENLKNQKDLLDKILEKLPNVKTNLEVEKTKIQNLEEELSKITFSKKIDISLVEDDFFADEYDLCKNHILSLEKEIAEIEENFNLSKSNFEKLSSTKKVLENQKETRQKEKEEALKKFEKGLKESDFASENQVLESVLEEKNLLELKKYVENWHLKVNSLKTLLAEEKDYFEEDLEKVQNQIEELEQNKKSLLSEKETFQTDFDDLKIKIANLENNKINYDKIIANQEAISEKAAIYEKLHKAVSGDNPKKTPFDAWYLGIFLSEITHYASIRLKEMSGRYTMRLGGAANNRGHKGLDIEIVDKFTKKPRSVDSLSGGETFLASLSLALALTDTVQNKKGGIQLDSLFIDEGFGSLDDSALENAIATLDQIRENRNIGIISHVAELKNRDFNRFEVDKSNFGSKIQVKIFD